MDDEQQCTIADHPSSTLNESTLSERAESILIPTKPKVGVSAVSPKKSPPARPARPNSGAKINKSEESTSDEVLPSNIVTFDVGGIIFRCKTRLIEKFPKKRLHRLMLCGCERSSSMQTLFIDRNPAYFAVILEFYRTNEVCIPSSIPRAAVVLEAEYFDLAKEMFPHEELNPSSNIFCFAKSLTYTISPAQPPIVFILRPHEQLVLDTASGSGRLLLRVSDMAGTTTIPQAVLYDSDSYFFLTGGPAKLHGTPFPGNLIYSFWAEDYGGSGHGICVEFKLRCTFQPHEQLAMSLDDQVLLTQTIQSIEKMSTALTTKAIQSIQPIQNAILQPKPARTPIVPEDISTSNFPTKVNATSLPEKTKERAQILEETQLFQAKLREHSAWLQHHQRELVQQQAVPSKEELSPRKASDNNPIARRTKKS
ncbi:hypothetical protein THRCLA_06675 [Thraustotheca clavata]|uniref:Potassium channel tetramerisation-type BTB domain-containing protein n=1 Tax=Thraustotheca clavata TaxID=74557 RepID=A0A1V9ZLA0_9STRA|nr:hypothetical protein THRCLA_06675 [Thraustotheca clavata]